MQKGKAAASPPAMVLQGRPPQPNPRGPPTSQQRSDDFNPRQAQTYQIPGQIPQNIVMQQMQPPQGQPRLPNQQPFYHNQRPMRIPRHQPANNQPMYSSPPGGPPMPVAMLGPPGAAQFIPPGHAPQFMPPQHVDFQIPMGGTHHQMQYRPQQAKQGQFTQVPGPSQPQGFYPPSTVYQMGQPSPPGPLYIVRAPTAPMTRKEKIFQIKDPNSNKDVTQEILNRQPSGSITSSTGGTPSNTTPDISGQNSSSSSSSSSSTPPLTSQQQAEANLRAQFAAQVSAELAWMDTAQIKEPTDAQKNEAIKETKMNAIASTVTETKLAEKPVEKSVKALPKEAAVKTQSKEAVQGSQLSEGVSVDSALGSKSVISSVDVITSAKEIISNVRDEIFTADEVHKKEAQQSSTAAVSDVVKTEKNVKPEETAKQAASDVVPFPETKTEKYLREPTRTNRETRQEQKATLHEEPTRGAQQLTSRQEQLQQQKELGEAGLREQLREKENQKQNLERRLRRVEQEMRGKDEQQQNIQRQLREKDGQQKNLQRQLRQKDEQQENSQRQLREMEQRLREKDEQQQSLQTQLREKDGQQENLQRQLEEMRQQLRVKDEEQQNLQRQMREMEQQLIHCQGQLREKAQEVNELELSFSLAQQTITEQRRQETCDWVVSRNEIQMTDRCLGRGGWGSVNEGKYCGCPVAVKQIYELILSPHNRRLFEREMNIASKCRHPCLLQFIGATNDEGSPLFVTELMETSLRALLEQRQLSETETTVISLDVALGLNYLHQKKPSPIIHRDVSSANVLLWRQGDQWRAKVSDYGTANFLQNTMTVGPGAMIYSAPEAHTSNQTVKVDVYSFGVLLCEMSIRELPDPGKRDEQVLLLTNRVLRGLVRRCLQTDPNVRPNMQEIIDELSTRG